MVHDASFNKNGRAGEPPGRGRTAGGWDSPTPPGLKVYGQRGMFQVRVTNTACCSRVVVVSGQ